MINFFKKFVKNNNQKPPHEMSHNFDKLFKEIVERKYWENIDVDIIKAIFKKANEDSERIKCMVYISEFSNVLQDNFLEISKMKESGNNYRLSLFSMTLYRLGASYHEKIMSAAVSSETDELFEKEWHLWAPLADMAYMSSILCDEFELSAYHGMAFLYSFQDNGKVSLNFCEQYKAMEGKILDTPDEHLNYIQKATKDLILNPKQEKKVIKEMKEYGFVSSNYPDKSDTVSQGKKVEELKQKILLR